tara:strand:- start:5829 stop:6566 length:738 start_codon:yes stop_codon:yes gene_type:complete
MYVLYINSSEQQLSDRIFYLLLILFGLSVGAFLFGAMNSYATLQGQSHGYTTNLAGPVVAIVLTVAGGFYLPKDGNSFRVLDITVKDNQGNELNSGVIVVNGIESKNIEHFQVDGWTQFKIEDSYGSQVQIEVNIPGYSKLTRNLQLRSNSEKVEILVQKQGTFKLLGKVKQANEYPIPDVEIHILNTSYTARSVSNGEFTLEYEGFQIGDKIELETSHPGYEDKQISLEIQNTSQEIEIVLARL